MGQAQLLQVLIARDRLSDLEDAGLGEVVALEAEGLYAVARGDQPRHRRRLRIVQPHVVELERVESASH